MSSNQLSHDNTRGLGMFFDVMAKALTLPPPGSEAVDRENGGAKRVAVKGRRRGLLERLDQWLWRQQQREIEAYLAKATDVYDLEARIRALERGVPHPYY